MPGHHNQPHGISRLYGLLHQPWMKSYTGWIYNLLAAALILMAGLVNYDARDSQWQEWQTNKPYFFADGSPLVSTTDAGYFLSYARDYQEGKFDFDQSRSWPEHAEDPPEMDGATDIPLLSVIIRHLADTFYNGDLLMAGNAMIPFTALLTAIAIGLSFWAAGFPAEGAIAGLGTGLSYGYFLRTSIGRIDTDQLILFFISLVLGAILLACRQADRRRGIFFILLAAGLFHLFHWWYDRPLFLVLMPGIVFAAAILHRTGWKTTLILTGVFILAINPVNVVASVFPVVLEGLGRVEISSVDFSQIPLSFPDTGKTIGELGKYSFAEILNRVTGMYGISVAGIIGAGIWMVLYPARGIVFLPFIVIGLMSSIIGQRFAFYAAPMIWFGTGWLGLTLIRALHYSLKRRSPADDGANVAGLSSHLPVIGSGLLIILFLASFQMNTNEQMNRTIGQPSFPADIIRSFTKLAKLDQGRGGVIASWWDYGYIIHFKTGLPTLHDPGSKGGPRTYFLGRGFVDPDPDAMINSIRYISEKSDEDIAGDSQSLAILNAALRSGASSSSPQRPVYIVLTGQMTHWLRSMAVHGLHDLTNDTAPSDAILDQYGYFQLPCKQTGQSELDCNGQMINFIDGTVDGQPALSQVVKLENGFVREAKNYERPGRYTLILEKTGTFPTQVFVVPHRTWASSFNQLYRLGLYDENRLKLILDDYPSVRVFEILQ